MFSKQILVAALGVFATLSGAVAHDVSFGTCAGNVESVSITPCNEEPCTLKYEKSYEIDLAFTSNIDSENPRSNVESSYLGADVLPYPGQSPSACPYISGNCPLVSGQRYELKYTTQITLHPNFDNFRFNLTDGFEGQTIFCVDVPLKSEGTSDI